MLLRAIYKLWRRMRVRDSGNTFSCLPFDSEASERLSQSIVNVQSSFFILGFQTCSGADPKLAGIMTFVV